MTSSPTSCIARGNDSEGEDSSGSDDDGADGADGSTSIRRPDEGGGRGRRRRGGGGGGGSANKWEVGQRLAALRRARCPSFMDNQPGLHIFRDGGMFELFALLSFFRYANPQSRLPERRS